MSGPLVYEDCVEAIDRVISLHKSKWHLSALPAVTYDDISQEIRLHIWQKWDQYDQTRPIEGWVSTICKHQIINKLRDHYYSKTKPCIGDIRTKYKPCPFARGDSGCDFTPSGKQCAECPIYANWLKRKARAYNVKLPVAAVHHENEISSLPSSNIDYEAHFKLINKHVRRYLNQLEYKIYRMLYVKKQTEEDVAKMLGLKTSEKYRISGYRQINTYKARIMEKIKKMLEIEDILGA